VALAEAWLPAAREQPVLSRGAVHDFTAWFLFEGLLRAALDAGYVAVLFAVLEATTVPLQIPYVQLLSPLVRAIVAIVVADFVLWWNHWLMHKVSFLWAFHAVHHSQRELNLFTNLRFHIGEVLVARTIRYTPLYLLGLEVELAVWVPVVIESYERIYHANLRTGFGPLKYVLVTPQSHRIHHSREPRHADQNFGILFSFWDRLFGTQCREYDAYPATGIRDAEFPSEQSSERYNVFSTYFAQFLYPFRRVVQSNRPKDAESA
jgi:sterol desaturase/sphingolipid hydroxylase (fatty acid hydroxylase superfamily)